MHMTYFLVDLSVRLAIFTWTGRQGDDGSECLTCPNLLGAAVEDNVRRLCVRSKFRRKFTTVRETEQRI